MKINQIPETKEEIENPDNLNNVNSSLKLSPNKSMLSKNNDEANIISKRKATKESNNSIKDPENNLDKSTNFILSGVNKIEDNKKACIFTNTNPIIHIDKSISVSQNGFIQKVRGDSKSCTNFYFRNINQKSASSLNL